MFTQTRSAPEVIRYEDDNRYILLRRSQMNDVAQLCAGVQDSLTELKRYMPWAHFKASNTLEAQTKRCEDLIQAWDSGRDFTFNLFVRQPDGELRFSGCLGLHPRCLGNHGLEVGYWVRSDNAGKGLCTLAVKMVLLAGFEVMGLKRIQVGCDVANLGSRRVIEKVGFEYEGRQRNMNEVDPPAEVLQNGWSGHGDTLAYAMIPEDLEGLDWVKTIRQHLHFESL